MTNESGARVERDLAKPEGQMFYICRGKGFHLPLPNGYAVSIQFGPGNYCDHYNRDIGRDEKECGELGSAQVECAVLAPGGGLIDLKDFSGSEDSVVGYIGCAEVLRLINWAAALGDASNVLLQNSALDGGRWRHVKRGTDYTVVAGSVTLQTSLPMSDGADLVVYRGDDGKAWARPITEFTDGRFERLYDPPYVAPEHAAPVEARHALIDRTPRTNALIAEFAEPGGIVKAERLRAMNIRLVDFARALECELDVRKGDPVTRLHNLCAALEDEEAAPKRRDPSMATFIHLRSLLREALPYVERNGMTTPVGRVSLAERIQRELKWPEEIAPPKEG